MALIAMTTADTVDYVSDLDPSKKKVKVPIDPADESKGFVDKYEIGPGATVFKLRGLDVFLNSMIYDNASMLQGLENSEKFGIQTKVNQTNLDAVRHGLIGLKNFSDAKGNAVGFETQKAVVNGRPYDVVSDKVMNTLGIRLIQELASKIKEISEVTAAEEKTPQGRPRKPPDARAVLSGLQEAEGVGLHGRQDRGAERDQGRNTGERQEMVAVEQPSRLAAHLRR